MPAQFLRALPIVTVIVVKIKSFTSSNFSQPPEDASVFVDAHGKLEKTPCFRHRGCVSSIFLWLS
jgi:hypothetical protein